MDAQVGEGAHNPMFGAQPEAPEEEKQQNHAFSAKFRNDRGALGDGLVARGHDLDF